jgi:hypothetical protein
MCGYDGMWVSKCVDTALLNKVSFIMCLQGGGQCARVCSRACVVTIDYSLWVVCGS